MISKEMETAIIRLLQDADYVRDHLYIGLRRASSGDKPIIRRDGEQAGTEQYLFVQYVSAEGDTCRAYLSPVVLEGCELTEQEAWACAYTNTCEEGRTVIEPLPQVLLGLGCPMFSGEEAADELPLFVISNPQRFKGSGQIVDKAAIHKYFKEHSPKAKKLIVIPSSVHECLLIPDTDGTLDLKEFNRMVQEVNSAMVDVEDQLADEAFVMDLAA